MSNNQFRSLLVILILSCSAISYAQSSQKEDKQFNSEDQKGVPVFKYARVLNDQSDVFEVINISAPTFSTSNIVDGTAESFNHKLRVAYNLQLNGSKGSFQLVFFGEDEKVPFAVNTENGLTTIYMPYVVHDNFKSKLDQAISARKKVQVKINLLTSGKREVVWLF